MFKFQTMYYYFFISKFLEDLEKRTKVNSGTKTKTCDLATLPDLHIKLYQLIKKVQTL